MPPETLLLLGGNEGEPTATLARAGELIGELITPILARSRDHWTRPWGFEDHRLFLNQAVIIATPMEPEELLEKCLLIETRLGRRRRSGAGYTSRTIDIDILLMGDLVMKGPRLEIPHPRMHLRHFALAPAADIVPDMHHPVLRRPILQLLNDLRRP